MSPDFYALYERIKFHYKAAAGTVVVLKPPWGFSPCSQALRGGEEREGKCFGTTAGAAELWQSHCKKATLRPCKPINLTSQKKKKKNHT